MIILAQNGWNCVGVLGMRMGFSVFPATRIFGLPGMM